MLSWSILTLPRIVGRWVSPSLRLLDRLQRSRVRGGCNWPPVTFATSSPVGSPPSISGRKAEVFRRLPPPLPGCAFSLLRAADDARCRGKGIVGSKGDTACLH
jgi:hypothetical protein